MKKKRSVAKSVYTLADLKKGVEVHPPIRLGVFGDPVEHSLSPQMQNAALKHCKIDMQYARFHILPNELGDAIQLIRKLEFVGVNLTVPHKIAAFALVDDVDQGARRIGAVNTVKIDNGKLRGFNTDGRGSRAPFARNSLSIFAICACSCSAREERGARSRCNARKKIASAS